jgi:tRNA(fMet)-specific endonuclease VapC
MIYLPDTNAFSAYLAGRSKPLVDRMTAAFSAGELRLSVMVMSELEFGAEKARATLGETRFARGVADLRKQIEIEGLGAEFPKFYAMVRTSLEAAGRKIGDRDTIIAAHALSIGAVMVTANVDEFDRVPGLKVENWQLTKPSAD